jgi:hypothetical protein
MRIQLLFATLLVVVFARKPTKFSDLGSPVDFVVTSVPGYEGKIPFPTYAGYLPANDGDKQLFFW